MGLVDMIEEPMFQEGSMEEGNSLGEYSVGAAAETLVMFGAPHHQIILPENVELPSGVHTPK